MKATVENVKEVIVEADVLVNDTETLDPSIKLTEQGIDSLDIVNIYLLLEEKFGVKIPDEDLDKLTTIDDIIKYINDIKN